MKILIVEDDRRIVEAIAEALRDQNYVVESTEDGQTGLELAQDFAYDLILLDLMLPKISGVSVCQTLRKSGFSTPILMLTARDTSQDKVLGLDAGADDYVVKPFDLPELLARIRALLRRNITALPTALEWGELRLDSATCEVTYANRVLSLTPKEYSLLELFLRSNGRVLSRSAILDHLWSFSEPPSEDAVKVHIKELRKKLRLAGASTDWITTVYGLGYRLKPL